MLMVYVYTVTLSLRFSYGTTTGTCYVILGRPTDLKNKKKFQDEKSHISS